ncbi:AfsR/SARP family transcriptional regulator [Cryptosporangium minutisporangium]|uniref:BTAD domain-containing putative transcriptional regulator n=1 Tax=Cryptosporangium minutisporangium TaxID=113569 RepID=A0ABP6SYW0_9ACTN
MFNAEVEFRILGAMEVVVGGRTVVLSAAKHRIVLAALLVQADRVVSAEQLAEYIWDGHPPRGARGAVQSYVARVRRALGDPTLIVTGGSGYRLRVPPETVDLHRFRRTVAQEKAGPAADLAARAELLRSALALWRGPALSDVPSTSLRPTVVRLEEERLTALETRVGLDLRLGRYEPLVAELRELSRVYPLRERLSAYLVEALARTGQRADALDAFHAVRRRLRDELGIDPGDALRAVHQSVLTGELTTRSADPGSPASPADGCGAAEDAGPCDPPTHPAPAWRVLDQLPSDRRVYQDRAGLTDEIAALLTADSDGTPVVALCGLPGAGKTTLAVRVAHQVRERFPDGQWYVQLGGLGLCPRTPSAILAGLLEASGADPVLLPESLEERAAMLRARLADRAVLLVLDDAVDSAQVRPLLPGGRGCAVLVTSRTDLRGLAALDQAHLVDVGPLQANQSRTLLVRLLGLDHGASLPPWLDEVAELCGHLPLALCLAAANLVGRSAAETSAYLADLRGDARLDRLGVPGDREATIRRTIGQSYARLKSREQFVFGLLGLAPGRDFSVASVAALIGAPLDLAEAGLDALVVDHLVHRPTPGRYSLHDVIKLGAAEYGTRDLTPAQRRAALGNLYAHYLGTADAAAAALHPDLSRLARGRLAVVVPSMDTVAARAFLDAECWNLVATAAQAARDETFRPYSWHLADALRGEFAAHHATGAWASAVRVGLDAATADGAPAAIAAMRLSAGNLEWSQGHQREAITQLEQALTASRTAKLPALAGAALNNLGIVHLDRGEAEQALSYLGQAVELGRSRRQPFVVANSAVNAASAYLELGRLAEARATSVEAVDACDQLGAALAGAIARSNLGQACTALGLWAEAEEHLSQALDAVGVLGSAIDEAEMLAHLAALHRDAGRPGRALPLAQQASELADGMRSPRVLCTALTILADLYQRSGQIDQARTIYGRAADLADSARLPRWICEAQLGLAHLALDDGEPATAAALADAARREADRRGMRLLSGAARMIVARAQLAAGRCELAAATVAAATDLFRASGYRLGEAAARQVAAAALRHDDPAAAQAEDATAAALLTALGRSEEGQPLAGAAPALCGVECSAP